MARAARPDLVYKAICAGRIQWKDSAARNMRRDRKTKDFTTSGVEDSLCEYVRATGPGSVRERPETDEYWLQVDPEDPWWYKVNIPIEEYPDRLFVKTKLVDPDEDCPCVEIIGVHF